MSYQEGKYPSEDGETPNPGASESPIQGGSSRIVKDRWKGGILSDSFQDGGTSWDASVNGTSVPRIVPGSTPRAEGSPKENPDDPVPYLLPLLAAEDESTGGHGGTFHGNGSEK